MYMVTSTSNEDKTGCIMNAIIALCHFCELHGPSILFCTQAFHCANHNPEDVLRGAPATPSACGTCHNRALRRNLSFDSDGNSDGTSQEKTVTGSPSPSRQSTCEACRSLQPGEPGFISIDKESHISYISSQCPDEDLYSIVRHACVRSLSCEVCPGREGPIMFGDEAGGYVFSHTFFLKDSQSRGFQRWYSIICVMMDRIYLVNSWPFLLSNFRNIIDELQAKADAMYKTEQAEQPQRAQRLQMSANSFLLTPDQFRRSRGGNQNYRSLVDITRDKNIFQYLHQNCSWILKASGERYTEKLLEGPPPEDYLYEDNKEDDFKLEESSGSSSIDSNAENGPEFLSLRHLMSIVSKEKLNLIAYHVVRGDQLIVRCKYKNTIQSALQILKELIPAGCCRSIRFSDQYQDSWKCSFLGLVDTAKVPSHVLSSQLYVLLNITPSDKVSKRVETSMTDPSRHEKDAFKNYSVTVGGSSVAQNPTYLIELMKSIADESFTDSVFDVMLSTLKEEWMSKVKVLFKFSRTGSRTTEEKEKLLKILEAKPEDEILLKFWMTSLSRSYRSHLLTCSNHHSNQTNLQTTESVPESSKS